MQHYREAGDFILFVNEPKRTYDITKDFESLDAWKKAREVKLFFYKKGPF